MSLLNHPKEIFFTEVDKQILKNQVIDENNPGSILQDFKFLLDYINSNTVDATKANYHIAMKHLVPINEKLIHPIKLKLNRPQQKSFPNISGLYLLLCSIGIIRFIYSEKKHIMTLDETILELWNNLNPTEQYFTLLESWLLRSQPKEILGEYSPFGRLLLRTYLDFWKSVPKKGLQNERNRDIEDHIKYVPGLYNIALLELFGILSIQQSETKTGKGWRILEIKRTDFGNAISKYLYQLDKNIDYLWQYEYNYEIPFGEWQTAFQSYFPEWRNNLTFPETELKSGIYLFKVSLGNVWRRIEICSEMTLEDLTDTILAAFDFDKDHLYSYYYKNRFGYTAEINSPNSYEEPHTIEKLIGEIQIPTGSSMKFLYDFGDNWEFEVLLEKINPLDKKIKSPRIIEEHGEPPLQYPDWEDEWNDFE